MKGTLVLHSIIPWIGKYWYSQMPIKKKGEYVSWKSDAGLIIPGKYFVYFVSFQWKLHFGLVWSTWLNMNHFSLNSSVSFNFYSLFFFFNSSLTLLHLLSLSFSKINCRYLKVAVFFSYYINLQLQYICIYINLTSHIPLTVFCLYELNLIKVHYELIFLYQLWVICWKVSWWYKAFQLKSLSSPNIYMYFIFMYRFSNTEIKRVLFSWCLLRYINLPLDGTIVPQTSFIAGATHLQLSLIHFVNSAAGAEHIVNIFIWM